MVWTCGTNGKPTLVKTLTSCNNRKKSTPRKTTKNENLMTIIYLKALKIKSLHYFLPHHYIDFILYYVQEKLINFEIKMGDSVQIP